MSAWHASFDPLFADGERAHEMIRIAERFIDTYIRFPPARPAA